MRTITADEFSSIIKNNSTIKPRIKRDLRFGKSIEALENWQELELVAIYGKSGKTGVVLLQPTDELYILAFEMGGTVRDTSSGRTKAVICDFCYTWRSGGDAGLVTFYAESHSNDSTSQLCCFDLLCSQNVRTRTKASIMSRAQLREHITEEDRIERLKQHLQSFVDKLNLVPITI